VTAAKQLVAADAAGAALDMPAGPSEVLVIADDGARADFVAADLLAQAEHDASAQAILVTTSAALAREVAAAVRRQQGGLSRRRILEQSVASIRLIVVPDLERRSSYPRTKRHLLIERARALLRASAAPFRSSSAPGRRRRWARSGTNHVLPTYGYARFRACRCSISRGT
jgi:histidinol dehydrogenase